MSQTDAMLFGRLYADLAACELAVGPEARKRLLISTSNLAAHLADSTQRGALRALARGVAGLLWEALVANRPQDGSTSVARVSMRHWAREQGWTRHLVKQELCTA